MQDENTGLPIKSVKSFMSKIPSVFTGGDLIQWILKTLDVDDTTEALHLANLISSCGYVRNSMLIKSLIIDPFSRFYQLKIMS